MVTRTWITNINLFDATICSNSSLSNVAQVQYLLCLVKHSVWSNLYLFPSLKQTTPSCTTFCEIIAIQCEGSHLSTSIKSLISLHSDGFSSTKDLKNLLNSINENSQALTALECDIVENNPLLAFMETRRKIVKKF